MELPGFSFEGKFWKNGCKIVAGVDEVGRGSFAGPVVAAAVAFVPNSNYQLPTRLHRNAHNKSFKKIIINDSKKLSSRQREIADGWIKRNVLCYGIGWASVSQINRFGIKKASEIAFRKAIKNCGKKIDYLLIDAFYIPYVKGLRRKNQLPIIKGDGKSFSIAAASIIAKVHRDNLMTKIGGRPKYKKYGWVKNKGYGTLDHRNAIGKYGLTRLHRKKFVETWIKNSSFSPVR